MNTSSLLIFFRMWCQTTKRPWDTGVPDACKRNCSSWPQRHGWCKKELRIFFGGPEGADGNNMKWYYEGFTELDHVGSWPSCPQSICNINSFEKKSHANASSSPCLWDTNLAKLSAFHVSTCPKKNVSSSWQGHTPQKLITWRVLTGFWKTLLRFMTLLVPPLHFPPASWEPQRADSNDEKFAFDTDWKTNHPAESWGCSFRMPNCQASKCTWGR